MKKIKLQNISLKDKSSIFTKRKMYSVFLGNDIDVFFTDLKDAKAFLVATNEFLNQKLYELNALYMELFCEYRKAWFYFFNIIDSRIQNIGVTGVFREFEIIEKKITLMAARSGYQNGSSIVWHSFKISTESLQIISNSLISMYKSKKHYSEAYQVRVINERIKTLSDQLESWGKNLQKIDIYNT